MSEPSSHTAGPWQFRRDLNEYVIVQDNGKTDEENDYKFIAYPGFEGMSEDEAHANAYLIAAAPAMFEELRLLNAWFRLMVGAAIDSGSEPVGEWLRAFKHQERSTAIAIAKARGQS